MSDLDALRDFIDASRNLFVLTGAGCSTESGIPDYRGPNGTLRHRQPMLFAEFVRSETNRRRYWARGYVGWPTMTAAQPNRAHHAIARLEAEGRTTSLVTQNVDDLHRAAGSRDPIDLHGRLAEVICLACRSIGSRERFQHRLAEANESWEADAVVIRPDGDAVIDDAAIERFRVPPCESCGGTMKPHVVFFGENVPRERVDRAFAALGRSDAILVVGSSLTVWSGYRFVRAAADHGIPIAIVNLGATRGDELAALRIEASCGDVLQGLWT